MKVATFGHDHAETMTATTLLGVMYWREKRLGKSVPLFEELLKLQSVKFGREHVETLATAANLAVNYRDSDRLAEALPLFEEAYRGSKKLPESLRKGRFRYVVNYLLEIYRKTENHIAAANLLLEELPEARLRLPKESPELAAMLSQIGLGLLDEKRYTEAEPLLRECLTIREVAAPMEWSTFNAKSLLGGSLLGQKRYSEAEPLLVSGYEGMKQREATIPAQGKQRLPESLDRLVEFYAAIDKPEDAKKWRAERDKYSPKEQSAPEKR